jgi:hypothetical protein
MERLRIELTESERQWAYKRARQRNWREHGDNPRARAYGVDPLYAHYIGIVGELAFCIYAGLDPDEAIAVHRGHGDEGVDQITPSGVTVQVKTTGAFNYPQLRVGVWEKTNADVFVLCAYDREGKQTVDLVGGIWTEDLLRVRVTSYRDKRVRSIRGSELDPLDSIFGHPELIAGGWIRATPTALVWSHPEKSSGVALVEEMALQIERSRAVAS